MVKYWLQKAITGGFKHVYENKPSGGSIETNLVASNELKFDTLNQYGSIASARTGDITVDFQKCF